MELKYSNMHLLTCLHIISTKYKIYVDLKTYMLFNYKFSTGRSFMQHFKMYFLRIFVTVLFRYIYATFCTAVLLCIFIKKMKILMTKTVKHVFAQHRKTVTYQNTFLFNYISRNLNIEI